MTITTPGPYEAKIPRNDRPRGGYRTAEQELSEALEGTAPALTRTVSGLIGPARSVELAKAIRRATDLAVRRHAMDKLSGALAVVEAALDDMPPECEAVEQGPCVHDWQPFWDGSLGYSQTDRCTRCGAYRPTPDDKQACWRCGDEVYCLSTRGWCDGCEAELPCACAVLSEDGRCVSCGRTWKQVRDA